MQTQIIYTYKLVRRRKIKPFKSESRLHISLERGNCIHAYGLREYLISPEQVAYLQVCKNIKRDATIGCHNAHPLAKTRHKFPMD